MGSTRRRFTDEYKAEAVQYVLSSGQPVAEVARNLGIVEATLGRCGGLPRCIESGLVNLFGLVDDGVEQPRACAGRAGERREVWRDSRDYARTMAAVQVIERGHGLVAVDSPGRRTARRDGRAQSGG